MSDHLTLVHDDGITRREFTLDAVLAILATCVITISDEACGSSSTPTTPTPVNDVVGSIATNHATPHSVTVTGAQITAGTQVALTLTAGQGSGASHTHTVTLTSADLNTLKNKGGVATETSSLDANHTHVVTFTQT
jgi:hypothetical protein